jgi:AraC-like DNA-binding protein
VRLVILARSPGASGSWHRHQLSLADGAAVLLGATGGHWRAPHGLRGIQVNVPRQAVPVTDAQLETFTDQRRLRHDPTFAGLIGPALLGLTGHLDALAGTDLLELEQAWISLLNMLVRSLAGQDTTGTDTARARRLQARRYIRANLANPHLSPGTIANALHVSRSTLYAALGPDADGLAAEIRRHRLQRAHALLGDPANSQPIAEIAAAVGIPNAAHFSRIFRDQHGLTPANSGPNSRRTASNERRPNHHSAGTRSQHRPAADTPGSSATAAHPESMDHSRAASASTPPV